jgi:RNA polymerase sigma factor (sigma-70 family)
MTRPDAELVAAARTGDAGAFAALAERHYGTLLATCRRALGDPQWTRDAAQEAVVTAMLGLDHLRSDERFGAWLLGIALNTCRHVARRERRRPAQSLEAAFAEGEPAAPSPGPEEAAEAAETAARVRRAIAALPPGQREAVRLFYFAGLTHDETAEELGTAVSAVKTRLHKARRALQHQLHDMREEHAEMPQPVPVRVADLRRTADEPVRHVVFLEAEDGRRVPMWIGAPEAVALACRLEDVELPRPSTQQLALALLEAAGAELRVVTVSRLIDHVFYAQIELAGGGIVDARPSDALTLALLADVPVAVEPAVLDEAARTEPALRAELDAALAAPDDAGTLASEARARIAASDAEVAALAERLRA